MKETIKHYLPFALTALCAVFAIPILFSIFPLIGESFTGITQKDYTTTVAQNMKAQLAEPLPTLKYAGATLTVGDANAFEDLFLIQFSDGTTAPLEELSDTSLYLVDIKLPNDTSVLSRLSSTDIDTLEAVPSAAIYDTEQQLLYFHKHGIYTFYIRLYYKHRPGILYECQVPVETR